MMSIRKLLQATLLLWMFPGVAWTQDASGCTEQQVRALQKSISSWVKPATVDGVSPILALACKVWPANPDLTITSAIFEPKDQRDKSSTDVSDGTKEWVTLVADKKSARPVAIHRGEILVDAAVRIHESSLVIDTAPYRLAPGIVAFGVRKNTGYSPNCADGGSNDFLTLFVYDQGKLQPVLGEPDLTFWSLDFESGHHPCGPEQADYRLATGSTILRLLRTASNGFADIEFVSTVTPSWEKATGQVSTYPAVSSKTTARYDGKKYVIPDWSAHTSAVLERALERAAAAQWKKQK